MQEIRCEELGKSADQTSSTIVMNTHSRSDTKGHQAKTAKRDRFSVGDLESVFRHPISGGLSIFREGVILVISHQVARNPFSGTRRMAVGRSEGTHISEERHR